MRVTLSAAVTADGFLDDNSPRRLIISTPEDWAEVYRLRAAHDAMVAAIEEVIKTGPRTPDLGGPANTTEMGEAVAALIAHGLTLLS